VFTVRLPGVRLFYHRLFFRKLKNKISNRINAIAGSHVGAAEAELLLVRKKERQSP
jgi:hypothetical protein